MAPSTPARALIASNSLSTASSHEVREFLMMNEPMFRVLVLREAPFLLMISWIAIARRTDSSVAW